MGQRGYRCCQHLPRYRLHGAHFTPQRYSCLLIASKPEIKTGACPKHWHRAENPPCPQKTRMSWQLRIPLGNHSPDPWLSKAQDFFQLTVTNCWLVFNVNFTKVRVILEEGTSIKKIPPPDWPVGKSVVHFLALHAISKQAEQITGSKRTGSTLPWFLNQLPTPGSCPDFPEWWTNYKMRQSFLSVLLWL